MKMTGKGLARILEIIGMILIPTTIISSLFQLIRLMNIDNNLLETKYGLNPVVFFSSKSYIIIYTVLMILSTCFVTYGLILFIKLMRAIKSTGIFSDQSISILKSLSKASLIWGVYTIACTAWIFKLMSPKIINGMKITHLIAASSFGVIFLVVILSSFTFLISKGNKLKQEQDLTI